MRIVGLIAAGLAGVAVAVVPALGANVDVNAGPGQSWTPATVTISTGDTVTFRNQNAGTHNLVFDDGAPGAADGNSWMAARRFDQAGTYVFRCTLHQPAMTGQVVVNASSSTGTTTTGTTTTGTTDTTPTATTPTTPTTTGPATARPVLTVRLVRSTACTRRSKACRRPGVALRITADAGLSVTGTLERRSRAGGFRADGRVRLSVPAGTSTVRLLRRTDGRVIGTGSYRLTLTGVRQGSRSAEAVVRFTVRR